MQCTECGEVNPAQARFCIGCGTHLASRCASCHAPNPPHANFCASCGTALTRQSRVQGLESTQVQSPGSKVQSQDSKLRTLNSELSDIEAERKIITILFADLKGSMSLIEDLDPEDAQALVDPILQIMMDAVHRYDGYVAQSTGDGIFAFFGAPIAHEDHAQRAVYAALRMQEEIGTYGDRVRLSGSTPAQIRVGINTGEVVLRSLRKDDFHVDYTPVGHSTGLAARMESLAKAGSIIVSEYTYKLTQGYFAFRALGAARVKGLSEPLNIYEVLGVGPLRTRLQMATRRGLTRFVGRRLELERLRQALVQAHSGQGQIVGVIGEPGVGKSRLLHEFKQLVPGNWLVLETASVAHSITSPYLPLIELLKVYFRIQLADDQRARRQKVVGKVLELDRSLEDSLPYLHALLGIEEQPSPLQRMDPQLRRRRMREAVKRLFVRESLNQPVLLIFEDVQWIDSETQAFLDTLSDSVANARLLLLVNYRPEYRTEWGQRSYYTPLRLAPFGEEEIAELLAVLLGNDESVTPVKQQIVVKTDGTPFFIEEIIQALFEEGVLVQDSAGIRCIGPLPTDLRLPSTVQGILAARIDRLAPEEKALLQQLAVIGREFPAALIYQVVAQSEQELDRLLASLQRKEFLYEQPTFPDVEYRFKHALTQEVAYNSVLIERRKALHQQTAQTIESFYHDRLEEHWSALAYHYTRSGTTDKAVDYLQLTGQQSLRRSAYTEGAKHFTAAVDLLGILPQTTERTRQELALQLSLAACLQATTGPAAPEVEQAYSRARALCRPVGEESLLFAALHGLWLVHQVRADLVKAREIGEELLHMAERLQSAALLQEAHRALGSTLLWHGEFSRARDHLEQSSRLYTPHVTPPLVVHGGVDSGVSCLCEFARVLWFLGYPEQALRQSEAALTLAHSFSDPFSLAFALVFAAGVHQFRREAPAAQRRAEEGIALAREHGFPALVSAGTIRRGWALVEQGHAETGLNEMQQGLSARQAVGAALAQPYFLALQAEAYGKLGQENQALTLLSHAFTTMHASGEHRLEAELYRLYGELSSRQGERESGRGGEKVFIAPSPSRLVALSSPEECFLTAIAIARRQQAKSLELRATMSLVRLRQQQVLELGAGITEQEAKSAELGAGGREQQAGSTPHVSRTTQYVPRTTHPVPRARLDEAHHMLAEVYAWFTEGFDTKDMQEAKALLAALA